MKTVLPAMLVLLLFSSCASILNGKTTKVKVITNVPTQLSIDGDTMESLRTEHTLVVDRKNSPLEIAAFSDSTSKTVYLKSKNSVAFYANTALLIPYVWPGIIGYGVDFRNAKSKRYTYPSLVYMDFENTGNDYLLYDPSIFESYTEIVKIDLVSPFLELTPGITVSYEMIHKGKFSMEFSGSYFLPNNIESDYGYGQSRVDPNITGFGLGFEERYYWKHTALLGPYIGLELEYSESQHRESHFFANNDSAISINYLDTLSINNSIVGINFKIGRQFIINRISIDLSTGFGVNYSTVSHTDRLNYKDTWIRNLDTDFEDVNYYSPQEGSLWNYNIPIYFKIGYLF